MRVMCTVGNMTIGTFQIAVILTCVRHGNVFQMKGDAEAFAVEAKAKAEAEQMEKKANAWKEYQDAAIVDMILEVLPKVIFFSFQLVFSCRACLLIKLSLVSRHV
jgi:L-cystine uptake protein TcyP (sodium:dicarboxylate symporter family)